MITLGIESTAHTLGIGIVKDGKILSNIFDTYVPKKGGIHPREAADHHAQLFSTILKDALDTAGIKLDKIELISFAQGPGIGAPLSIGVTLAKYLGYRLDVPIIGVNHPVAHILISEHVTGLQNPLVLFISGANTQIIDKNGDALKILGETMDLGAGNLFDMIARELELVPPNGKTLSDLAVGGKYIQMPYSIKGMNVSLSGVHTQVKRYMKMINGTQTDITKKDIAFSAMETVFSEIVEVVERALFLTKKESVIMCGGVAQNRRLQEMLKLMAEEDGIEFGVGPNELNRDNGAMIAFTGEYFYKKYGTKENEKWEAKPRFRIEEYVEGLLI